MPSKVKVRVLSGRNLPVMDRANDTTDAFVEIRLGAVTQKTDVCRRSLNPQWNSDWFRFEVQDDAELQDEPLQIRVMDHDTYSAHDAIGKVYLSLSPLLASEWSDGPQLLDAPSVVSGWIPIYDTLHGIRGEINIMVKVDLFADFNKLKQSSCGVQFFSCPGVPAGCRAVAMLGFVQQLVVNDDPEYQWIDKIRTPRASNEARQTLFSKLSGEVQRRIGMAAIEAGGNAVIGYRQCFDLEGETGIVVRGIGTAVSLVRSDLFSQSSGFLTKQLTANRDGQSSPAAAPAAVGDATSPTAVSGGSPYRPAASSITDDKPSSSVSSSGAEAKLLTRAVAAGIQTRSQQQEAFEAAELPFLTMRSYPPGFIVNIGGTVSTRSVKLLDRINQPEESETRDSWWTEIRTEIRSHCKALACTAVLGYEERTSICDEVCVLSACGTAATVNFSALGNPHPPPAALRALNSRALYTDSHRQLCNLLDDSELLPGCGPCHIPYNDASLPLPAVISRCNVCRRSKVPDIIFCTIDPPDNLPTIGRGCLVQAQVCREKADLKSEQLAKEISDRLPFLEYELHRQLVNKLRIVGMNALFDLKIQISIGDEMMVAVATATAVYLAALPVPVDPCVVAGAGTVTSSGKLDEAQRQIADMVSKNRQSFHLPQPLESVGLFTDTDLDDSEDDEDKPDLDLVAGNKEACVLEIDDAEDVDTLCSLLGRRHPDVFELVSTRLVPGAPEQLLCEDRQLFTRCVRTKLSSPSSLHLSQLIDKVTQSLYFKLRKLAPCALCGLTYSVDLPEGDDLQICVYGCAVSMREPLSRQNCCSWSVGGGASEDQLTASCGDGAASMNPPGRSSGDSNSPQSLPNGCELSVRGGYDVIVTPLSRVVGAQVDRHLGYLNCFFIRECTGLREVGGLNGFMQSLITEVLAVLRAHVMSLGGNALLSYFMSQCVLLHNPHKNQAQCLVNVGGDVVQVCYTAST